MKFKIYETIYGKNSNNEINKRKHKHSLSPFCKLDGGNVEYNVNMFNRAMGSENISGDVSGIGEALNEALSENKINSLVDEYMDVLIWLEDK